MQRSLELRSAEAHRGASADTLPLTLVLGGGGYPGIAYLAGALQALKDHGGIDPSQASLIIGTSAGAVVGAMLRSGVGVGELFDVVERCALRFSLRHLTPGSFADGVDLMRRAIGSAWIAGRAISAIPFPPTWLDDLPSGFGHSHGWHELRQVLADDWPDGLWLVAYDLATASRRTLSGGTVAAIESGPATVGFADAILASTSIPMVAAPLLVGREILVDGGLHSTTNADLGLAASTDPILCIAPICYDIDAPPGCGRKLGRSRFQATLESERRMLLEAGRDHLFIAPTGGTLDHIKLNFLSVQGLEAVRSAAYGQVSALVERPHVRKLLRAASRRAMV